MDSHPVHFTLMCVVCVPFVFTCSSLHAYVFSFVAAG